MPDTVLVTLERDLETAAALRNPATPARVERLIQGTARPAGVDQLFATMHSIAAATEPRGLTEEILDEEFAAPNAERRGPPPPA